jgi:hypothetical protein
VGLTLDLHEREKRISLLDELRIGKAVERKSDSSNKPPGYFCEVPLAVRQINRLRLGGDLKTLIPASGDHSGQQPSLKKRSSGILASTSIVISL